MKKTDAELHWLALSLSPHIGANTLASLQRYFNRDLAAVLAASPAELQRVAGVGPRIAADISAIDLKRLQRDAQVWRQAGLQILRPGDADYPAPLAEAADAPPILFALGALDHRKWAHCIAIVGTRQPTQTARYITLELSMKLARAGCAIISGLALGIDTAAHTSALTAGGFTCAVLGSGLCNIYPEGNRSLAARIRESGLLLSETHPQASANAQRLVSRNRIISGLARAVIVIESQLEGGSMYTARFAAEQGRPVYTYDLPASGNQALIRDGALTLQRDDPLDALLP